MSHLDFASNPGKEEHEVFIGRLHTFVVKQDSKNTEMMQALDSRWDPTTWDASTDVVSLELGGTDDPRSVADTLGRSMLHNRLFFRMTMAFTSLVLEMRCLTDECFNVYIPPLALFGNDGIAEATTDDDAREGVGRMCGMLQDTWNWCSRVRVVLGAAISNLAALYSSAHAKDNYAAYTRVHFPILWNSIAQLLSAVVLLEDILVTHDALRQGIFIYRKMLQLAAKDVERFDADEVVVEQFGRLLGVLERDLLSETILANVCDIAPNDVRSGENEMFFSEFCLMFERMVSNISDFLGTTREGEGRKKVAGFCGMLLLMESLFPTQLRKNTGDFKRICKGVIELHKKSPVIHVGSHYVFKVAQWIARRQPAILSQVTSDIGKEGMAAMKQESVRAGGEFIPYIKSMTSVVIAWASQISSSMPIDRVTAKSVVQNLTQLLIRGLQFAQDISRTVRNLIAIFECVDAGLNLTMVDGIHVGVQLLMIIRTTIFNKTGIVASLFSLIIQTQSFVLQRALFVFYMRAQEGLSSGGEGLTDQHSAMGQAMTLLNRPLTPQALVALDIAISIAFLRDDAFIDTKESEEALGAFATLVRLCSLQRSVAAATNCDFLYWQRGNFLKILFSRVFQFPQRCAQLPLVIQALHDCRSVLLGAKHCKSPEDLVTDFQTFVEELIRENLIIPLSVGIERELRFGTHGATLGQPFQVVDKPTTDLSVFTRLPPIRFFGKWLHLATEVEDYLDSQFYVLTVLTPNDWKTYEEMRSLAQERYGLHIAAGDLPGGILDQGLDVLVTTQNINVFVAHFTYNLNEQLFVQRPSVTDAKNLTTLHARHIANSIRTHGTGIMSTTVNYVYRALLKKLAILSQFLFDDHVKSRLMRDGRALAAAPKDDQTRGQYPIARAEKFVREMKALGVTEDGKTYLERFAMLVAEVGNALGYMRMVRSGGLRAIAEAAVFIPQGAAERPLEPLVNPNCVVGEEEVVVEEEDDTKVMAPQPTIDAIHALDDLVGNMSKKLSLGSDYFTMLLDAISKKLNDKEKYGHLENFYLIIPPMCISHVETMVRQKEQLIKKNKEGLICDDGFALGCVFLLTLFRTELAFDSLHWFEGVGAYYRSKRDEVVARMNSGSKNSKDDDDLKMVQLNLTMIDSTIAEYDTLEQLFTSCRVFFRPSIIHEEDEEEEED